MCRVLSETPGRDAQALDTATSKQEREGCAPRTTRSARGLPRPLRYRGGQRAGEDRPEPVPLRTRRGPGFEWILQDVPVSRSRHPGRGMDWAISVHRGARARGSTHYEIARARDTTLDEDRVRVPVTPHIPAAHRIGISWCQELVPRTTPRRARSPRWKRPCPKGGGLEPCPPMAVSARHGWKLLIPKRAPFGGFTRRSSGAASGGRPRNGPRGRGS